jgi:hypothetical protein
MVSKLIRAAALASALTLLVSVGVASAQSQDLRSPDARDAVTAAPLLPAGSQDLRSPGAADPGVRATTPPTIELYTPGGFDWGSAGIGAGGSLGLILVALAAAMALTHRPRLRARRSR